MRISSVRTELLLLSDSIEYIDLKLNNPKMHAMLRFQLFTYVYASLVLIIYERE